MIVGGVTQACVFVKELTLQTLLQPDISERVDQLLRTLESQDAVLGNSSMIIIGDSVLHSRFSLHETRMILQYHKARPLGSASVRYTPVYSGGAWRNLYLVRLGNYVLVTLSLIDKHFDGLMKSIEDFRVSFAQSRLEIPVEVWNE